MRITRMASSEIMIRNRYGSLFSSSRHFPQPCQLHASEQNDLKLAKKALEKMGCREFTKVNNVQSNETYQEQSTSVRPFWVRMKMLPAGWQCEMLLLAPSDPVPA
ncbi:hypothetical protein L486_02166 [Kwoniella mangroviensis CBS 10435]|uniref:Uncharacterized protein n=1 Tax=Kwoniella mangroviensis CBS 10435 TaxID=1331196 RepID=A0A1B9IVD5_9TREE|nr:hypothetical protein L486_02166 [Kwoniella mangroviensis CBS 10435]OCF73477.1 hypothetical protein I204_05318 [Kwoniella mangroviensis CBS 8886]